MQGEVDRDSPRFERVVPMTVLARDREPCQQRLTLRLLAGFKQHAGERQRMHYFELTSETDAGLLFTLAVTEDEFTELKHDQRIRVDFNAFPDNFVDLVERCEGVQDSTELATGRRAGAASRANAAAAGAGAAAGGGGRVPGIVMGSGGRGGMGGGGGGGLGEGEAGDDAASTASGGTDEGSRFVPVLTTVTATGMARLDIVETNRFKDLTHLSLNLQPGSDSAVKHYLAARLGQFKRQVARMHASGGAAASDAEAREQTLASLRAQLADAMAQREHAAAELTARHRADMSSLREEHGRAMASAAAAHQAELNDANMRAQAQASSLSEQVRGLGDSVTALTSEKERALAAAADLKRRGAILAKDLDGATAELRELKAAHRELEAAKGEGDRVRSESGVRVAMLEQQIRDKESVVARTGELLEASNAQCASLEESLQLYKASHGKLQAKLESSIAEINKGNAIIRGLQEDHRALKAKLRLKSTLVRTQEEAIAEKERALGDAKRQIADAKAAGAREGEAKEAALRRVADTEAKLRECRGLLQKNKEVVAYLNQEINRLQLASGPSPSHSHAGRPSFGGTYGGSVSMTPGGGSPGTGAGATGGRYGASGGGASASASYTVPPAMSAIGSSTAHSFAPSSAGGAAGAGAGAGASAAATATKEAGAGAPALPPAGKYGKYGDYGGGGRWGGEREREGLSGASGASGEGDSGASAGGVGGGGGGGNFYRSALFGEA